MSFDNKLRTEYKYDLWDEKELAHHIAKHQKSPAANQILFVFFYLPSCGHCHRAAEKLQKFHTYCMSTLQGEFPVLFRAVNAEKNFEYVYKLTEQSSFPRLYFFDQYGKKCQHEIETDASFQVDNLLRTMSRCDVKPKMPEKPIRFNVIDIESPEFM